MDNVVVAWLLQAAAGCFFNRMNKKAYCLFSVGIPDPLPLIIKICALQIELWHLE